MCMKASVAVHCATQVVREDSVDLKRPARGVGAVRHEIQRAIQTRERGQAAVACDIQRREAVRDGLQGRAGAWCGDPFDDADGPPHPPAVPPQHSTRDQPMHYRSKERKVYLGLVQAGRIPAPLDEPSVVGVDAEGVRREEQVGGPHEPEVPRLVQRPYDRRAGDASPAPRHVLEGEVMAREPGKGEAKPEGVEGDDWGQLGRSGTHKTVPSARRGPSARWP